MLRWQLIDTDSNDNKTYRMEVPGGYIIRFNNMCMVFIPRVESSFDLMEAFGTRKG